MFAHSFIQMWQAHVQGAYYVLSTMLGSRDAEEH